MAHDPKQTPLQAKRLGEDRWDQPLTYEEAALLDNAYIRLASPLFLIPASFNNPPKEQIR